MNFPDLSTLSFPELRTLSADIVNEIKNREQDEIKRARAQIQEIAANVGMSVEDLIAAQPQKAKATVAAKYRHPDDPKKEWTGRGRKPQWVVDFLAEKEGRTLDQLRIAA